MVKLVTLPGLSLDSPDINMPTLKGFLEGNLISAHVSDLNIKAFYTKMEKQSLISILGDSHNAMNKVDMISNAISVINGMIESSYEDYNNAADIIKEAMTLCSKPYGIKWDNKGIHYSTLLNSYSIVEESIANIELSFFDDVFDEFVSNITDDDRCIVLSVTSQSQYPLAIRLAKKIKDIGCHKVIVTGCYLPYISELLPAIVEKTWWIDHHIIGHIEDVIIELIEECDLNNKIIETEAWKNKKKAYQNNLCCIPDFDDLNLAIYLSKECVLPLQITNGCYYGKCKFCSFHYGDGSYSCATDRIIEKRIETYVNKYHARYIVFVDRCVPAPIVLRMCRYIVEKSFKIKWLLETRIDPLYLLDENAILLKKAGCKLISFGIESADQELLNQMNKGIDFSIAEKCMRNISEKGICVASTIMLLFFGERKESLQSTFNYLLTNNYLDLFGILFFLVTKHSPVYYENIDKLISSVSKANNMNQIFDRALLAENVDGQLTEIINHFFSLDIVKQHMECVSRTFSRSHYLFWPKEKYSFQGRKKCMAHMYNKS